MDRQVGVTVQERLVIKERTSVEVSGFIVSAALITMGYVKLVVGRPGLPSIKDELYAGGALLFEIPDGIFDVRVMSVNQEDVVVLVTQISPQPGIAGGLVEQDQSNARFSPDELQRIGSSLEEIRLAMRERDDVSPEQLDFISKKLDEIQSASERLGRKDWMNLAIGTLTSIIVTAALSPGVAKALFQAASAALSWVFGGGLKLLP